MNRTWLTRIESQEFIIEVDYGANIQDHEESPDVNYHRDGKLVVNGNTITTWQDVPKEIPFELGGKKAILRRKGFFGKRLDLFVNGEPLKPTD